MMLSYYRYHYTDTDLYDLLSEHGAARSGSLDSIVPGSVSRARWASTAARWKASTTRAAPAHQGLLPHGRRADRARALRYRLLRHARPRLLSRVAGALFDALAPTGASAGARSHRQAAPDSSLRRSACPASRVPSSRAPGLEVAPDSARPSTSCTTSAPAASSRSRPTCTKRRGLSRALPGRTQRARPVRSAPPRLRLLHLRHVRLLQRRHRAEGFAGAVLIRAVEPVPPLEGHRRPASCAAAPHQPALNSEDLVNGALVWLERRNRKKVSHRHLTAHRR